MRGLMAGAAALSGVALWLLGLGIYLFTLYLAYLTSFPALLATMFFPFLSQLYWIWEIWNQTGVLFSLLTQLCLAWLALVALLVGLSMVAEA